MGQAGQKRRAILLVEDDAELRSLTAAPLEDEQLDTIECESAEAALAIMLIGGREVAMIFVDIRLRGIMNGIDLAHEAEGAVAAASRCSHIGASARAHPRAPAWCRVQAVAAAQCPGGRRAGVSLCARLLTTRR